MADTKLVNMKTGTNSYESEDGTTEQRDEYPWGLQITLNDEVFRRLAISLPKVGDELMLTAKVNVQSTSTDEDGQKTRSSATMQITDMAITPAAQGEQPRKSTVSVMYGDDAGGE
jgi:hypothetical protein